MDLTQEERAVASRNFTLDLLLADQLAIRFGNSRNAAIKRYLKNVHSNTKVPDVYEYCQFMLKLDNRDLQKMTERLFYGIMGKKHQMTKEHHPTLHDVDNSPKNVLMAEAPDVKSPTIRKRKFTIPGSK